MRFPPTTLLLPIVVTCLLSMAFIAHAPLLYAGALLIGIGDVVVISIRHLFERQFSLDYIAFLALALAGATGEYVAGAVIALMYTGGEALEFAASRRATASLSALLSRIPKTAIVKDAGGTLVSVPLTHVQEGSTIIVRTGELVPLDGTLLSNTALLDLSNLTGEPLPEALRHGTIVKSGSVNQGEALELRVSGTLSTSTYAKIIDLVQDAERQQAPFVRFSSRANIPFTLITLFIAGVVYALTHDLARVLAVLVVATPCPLIIAAPVAFIGGLSRAAGRNIIVKTPTALEALSDVRTIYFDKTGTLTLGEPTLIHIECIGDTLTEVKALSLAAALEFHSIHPLARAITKAASARGLTPEPALEVTEVVGAGIQGRVREAHVTLSQAPDRYRREGSIALLLTRDNAPAAVFHFSDKLKDHAKRLLQNLAQRGYTVAILTGDKTEHAQALFNGEAIMIYGDCTPEEKSRIVETAKRRGHGVAMVGDGLNDAPALARADVGIVFSGTENSASIEAADVAILGHDLNHIEELLTLSKRSVAIARESVVAGIGLSTVAMLYAATGALAPVAGALLQEAIDIAVILNALRTALTPIGRGAKAHTHTKENSRETGDERY